MAKRKNQRRARRKSSAVSLTGMAKGYMLGSAATQTLFNVNLYDFFMADHDVLASKTGTQFGVMYGTGNQITLRELLRGKMQVSAIGGTASAVTSTRTTPTMDLIKENFYANWVQGATSMITIPIAFKLGKKFAAPALAEGRKAFKAIGLNNTVTV